MKIPNGDEISQLLQEHCEKKSERGENTRKKIRQKKSIRVGGKMLFSDANENSNGKHAERKQSKATPVACYYFYIFVQGCFSKYNFKNDP